MKSAFLQCSDRCSGSLLGTPLLWQGVSRRVNIYAPFKSLTLRLNSNQIYSNSSLNLTQMSQKLTQLKQI